MEFGSQILLARITHGYKNRNGGWSELKLCFLSDKDSEEFTPFENSYVIFYWGNGEPFNLNGLEHDIQEMWHNRGLIGYDQDKSKKRIMIEFEKDPGETGWKNPMQSYENGFIGIIASNKITNQIKKWDFLEAKNSNERQNLRQDLEDAESRFFFNLGIRHNPFSKEERQNNPEVISGQAYFYAWEVKREQGLVNGILEFQEKPWGGGEYLLQFGSLPTLVIKAGETKLLEEIQQEQLQRQKSDNLSSLDRLNSIENIKN